jgi:hypothetical protein
MFGNDPGVTGAPNPKPKAPATSPPTAPTGPGGHYTSPSVDIPGILATDPSYQGLLSLDKAASAGDLASLNKKMAQMKAYYGSDTDPLSLYGRIYQSYQDRNRQYANTLAGHGMIGSGETGFEAARSTLQYQQQEYDAQFKLQQYIQGLHDAFRAAEQQRAYGENSAAGTSVSNWINANPPTWVTDPTSPPPASTTFDWGGQTWGAGDASKFMAYLYGKGVKFSDWAAAHPSAAAIFGYSGNTAVGTGS